MPQAPVKLAADRLRSFLEIADAGSFNIAADRLHVTQSTISSRIQRLAAEVGQRQRRPACLFG